MWEVIIFFNLSTHARSNSAHFVPLQGWKYNYQRVVVALGIIKVEFICLIDPLK